MTGQDPSILTLYREYNVVRFHDYNLLNSYWRGTITLVVDSAIMKLWKEAKEGEYDEYQPLPDGSFIYTGQGGQTYARSEIKITQDASLPVPDFLSFRDVEIALSCIKDFADAWCASGNRRVPIASMTIMKGSIAVAEGKIKRTPPEVLSVV